MRKKRTDFRRNNARRPASVDLITLNLPDGSQALYVSPTIRESDPPAVREGIARRRILAQTGECPCGARSLFDPRQISPTLVMDVIHHENDCPATAANLDRAMRAARGGGRRG